MFVHQTPRRQLRLTRLLVACVVVSFALSAISFAYSAGRHNALTSSSSVRSVSHP